MLRLLPELEKLGVPVIAVTARYQPFSPSRDGHHRTWALQEACPLGLAPGTSTTAMLAVGDALALVASRLSAFGHADFAGVDRPANWSWPPAALMIGCEL